MRREWSSSRPVRVGFMRLHHFVTRRLARGAGRSPPTPRTAAKVFQAFTGSAQPVCTLAQPTSKVIAGSFGDHPCRVIAQNTAFGPGATRVGASRCGEQVPFTVHSGGSYTAASKPVDDLFERLFHRGK